MNPLPENPLAHDLGQVCDANPELWRELRGARIFLTGGTGFFGCWLLETLAAFNDRLKLQVEASILTRDPEAFQRKAPHLAANPAFRFVTGDVRTFARRDEPFTHVIHAATEHNPELERKQPQLMLDTIVAGTRRCLEFAAACGASNFLLTSSGAVYGPQPPSISHLPEDYSGGAGVSVYGEGKRMAEAECALAAASGKPQVKIARCFAFVGPYMPLDAHFAMGNFIRDHLAGGPIRVRGDGTPVRSYMYAADLVVWLLTILLRGENARAYNVGAEESLTIAEAAHQVATTLAPHVPVEIAGISHRGAAADRYVPSTQRARSELGLRCGISLTEGIRRTIEWYRIHSPEESKCR